MKVKHWLAINGASVARSSLPFAAGSFRVTPTPELLLGFPTAAEAAEAQEYLLTAPPEHVEERMATYEARVQSGEVEAIRPSNPEPPTPTGTIWVPDC